MEGMTKVERKIEEDMRRKIEKTNTEEKTGEATPSGKVQDEI